MDRRQFLVSSVAAAASATFAAEPRRIRLAMVGTGERGIDTWGQPVVDGYSDVVEIVGLCDINSLRAKAAQDLIGTKAPAYVDFEKMVRETKPDMLIITTMDAAHWRYIIRGLELGLEVLTEKPMCTDEMQCQAILDAVKKTGGKLTITFSARHSPEAQKIKELLMEKAIGDVISVDSHEYLDTSHGASYFRRWHHLKENSGTLLLTECVHHIDQVNWWLASNPVEVSAQGDLRVYGRRGAFRSTHCRVCPFKQQCQFYWDVNERRTDIPDRMNPWYVKLYVNCESEDGYLRDGCLFREDTNIYDTMSLRAWYENGVIFTHTTNAFLPYEGLATSINGTGGRIDWSRFRGGGFQSSELRLARAFGKSELIQLPPLSRTGGHGGSDSSMKDLVFRHQPENDPLGLRADVYAGTYATLLGTAGYRSIERGGEKVKVSSLVRL